MSKAKRTLGRLLVLAILGFGGLSYGQDPSVADENSDAHIYALIDTLLQRHYDANMTPGLAVSLVWQDSSYFLSYGEANIEMKEAVTSQTRFQLGSIGKLVTAIAVLQQVDRGQLDLHADITPYVRELGLTLGPDDNPVTLHCLLTHSCGFNDTNIGYMARDEASVLSLKDYIKTANPGLFQPPGTDISYSNFSYALAGLLVEEVTQTDFTNYVDTNIFSPLGMSASTLAFPHDYAVREGYANAYAKTKEGYEEAKIYPRHAIPAGSLVSTAEDMGVFIRALLNKDADLLSTNSWDLFYTQQFQNHPLLNGYGYGLEHQNINGKEAWAKGGMLPGVLSHILIVPDEWALFAVVNTSDDSFGEAFYKALFDAVYPGTESLRKMERDVSTAKYTGIYRDKRYNRNAEENIVSLFRGQWNVYDNETHDSLLVHHNSQWHAYFPIGGGVFQNDALPYEYLAFKEDDKREIVALYRNLNIGGLSIPTSYEKTRWYNSPVFINEYYGFIPIFIFTGIIFIISSLFVRLIRWKKRDFFQSKSLPFSFHLLFAATILLFIVHTILVPWQLVRNVQAFLLGYPDSYRVVSMLGYLMIPMAAGLAAFQWKFWSDREGSLFARTYLSLLEVCFFLHIAFLFYWSFF